MNNHQYSISQGIEHFSCTTHLEYLWPMLKSLLPKIPSLRVLDLGCGQGHLSHFIAQEGYQVVGVDLSKSSIKIAQQRYPECRFIQADIFNLPYRQIKPPFDAVISMEVIEHLYHPRELIRAAKKCLKPEGHLILSTPYHGYLKNLGLSLLDKWDVHWNILDDGWHIKFISRRTLSRLLEEEEFTNIHFKYAGRMPWFWKSMICSCSSSSKKRLFHSDSSRRPGKI
jgi:2-polyprenyl-3-methyl-5-hydroxy-6-metoxy-1,4-benzoquinol methylase